MDIIGYSKALYSTWFYAPEIRTLFDAGEGVNCVLAGRIAGMKHVAISHGHTDHFTGLMNVIITRMRLTAGDPEPPPALNVYYPAKDRALGGYIDYLRAYFQRFERRRPVVRWHPAQDGDRFRIGEKRPLTLLAFATDHTPDVDSLGFNVIETRKKLKPEFQELEGPQIAAIVREKGRDHIVNEIEHTLLSFSGDTRALPRLPCDKADLLIHEATFLSRSDADTVKHAVLDEVMELAEKWQPGRLVLYHYSTRYNRRAIDRAVRAELAKRNIAFPVDSCYPGVLRWDGREDMRGLPQMQESPPTAPPT